jgi:DNA-binding SARP family transcriptional activator
MEPLRVRLFGTPHVSYDERPVRFVASRTLPLFVYLLLGRERPIARDQLAYKFWPDCSEAEARANLRRHLHRVNGPLFEMTGRRWFEADDKVIAFDLALPIDLDVARLEAAVANLADSAGAVELYVGDLFEGCDDEWLIPHRERLRSTFLQIVLGLIDRYRGERRFPEAIALSQKALHVDPFREDVVRTLMSLHYESGDRAGALNEFKTFGERLQREIGADPMRETQSLHDAIKRHAAIEVNRPDRTVLERALPFAGRDDEIEALRHAWQQAADGKSRVAMVSGEAGIGKTRLLRQFTAIAEREGARVLWGASSAPEASPYEPVTDALAGAIAEIARLPLSGGLFGALTAQFPELRDLRADIPDNVDLTGQRERERLFDAIALATARLCALRPAVMILEDVHWVSADTFELIARIARTCSRAQFFLILSFREEEPNSALHAFRGDPALKTALRLGLGRLEASTCSSILLLANANVPAGVGDWAIALSKGNPLFLSELVRDYDARGTADTHKSRTLPVSLESAILARLSSLSEKARMLLDIAAIGGSIVSVDLLQFASGWSLAEILDTIDELVDRFVLRETASGARGDYQFAHALIRDAVVDAMPHDLQMRRHRRFAKAILALFPARQDDLARVLAQHFELAAQPEEAARFYARAAGVAHAQFAWQDAIALAGHALRLERQPRERFALHAAIDTAAAKRGDNASRALAVASMLELAEELDDDAVRAIGFVRSSELGLQTGNFERQRQATNELEALARKNGDATLLSDALRNRARGEIAAGRASAGVSVLQAIDAIDGLERPASVQIEDLLVMAHAAAAAADFGAARTAVERAELLAGPEPALADRVATVRARANLLVEMGARAEAAALSPVLLELARKIGDVEGEGNALQIAARIDAWAFDIDAARKHLRAAAAIFERIGKLQSCAAVATNSGALENHVGLLDDAERLYDEALSYADRLDSPGRRALCYVNFAYLALVRGDGERAMMQARRALDLARQTNDERLVAIGLGHSASAARLLGRDDVQTLERFEEALQLCETLGFVEERLELLAAMIPTLLSCGNVDRALSFAAELERAIGADESAVAMPVDALAKAADAREAAGDMAAAASLRRQARSLLRERLEKLPDERTRDAYAALRFHQPLLDEETTSASSPNRAR